VVRTGLRRTLEEAGGFRVLGEVGDGEAALREARKGGYDVILMDISMPGPNGLEVLKQLRSEGNRTPVLILSVYGEDQYALRVLKAGAAGYLTKETDGEELVRAVRTAAAGRKYVGQALAERIAEHLDPSAPELPHQSLSDREFEVFRLLAAGKTVAEVAEALHLGPTTVSTYRGRILEKLRLKTNAELIRYAVDNGLID
jgi:DNA-binding NarL/FixJ family response regulator